MLFKNIKPQVGSMSHESGGMINTDPYLNKCIIVILAVMTYWIMSSGLT